MQRKMFLLTQAVSATRGIVRLKGFDLSSTDVETALEILDDYLRVADKDLLISLWYRNASDRQIKLFKVLYEQTRIEPAK